MIASRDALTKVPAVTFGCWTILILLIPQRAGRHPGPDGAAR